MDHTVAGALLTLFDALGHCGNIAAPVRLLVRHAPPKVLVGSGPT